MFDGLVLLVGDQPPLAGVSSVPPHLLIGLPTPLNTVRVIVPAGF